MLSSPFRRFFPRTISGVRYFVNNIIDPSLVPNAREMEEGLVKQGAIVNPKVSIQLYEKFGLGLTATRKIDKFEPIAIVPRSLCIEAPSVDDLIVDVHRYLTTVERSKLVGIWKFLKYLYNYANLVSPILWGEKQEQQLVNAYFPEIEPDVLLQLLAEKRNHLQQINAEHKFKFDKFLMSVVLVESRCYELDEGSMNSQLLLSMIESPEVLDILDRMKMSYDATIQQQAEKLSFDPVMAEIPVADVIVPFIDLMNHSFNKDNCYVIYNQTKREFHAVAARDIPAGGQIMVDYGFHDDPAGLLMQYGIPPPMRHKRSNRRNRGGGGDTHGLDAHSAAIADIMRGAKEEEQEDDFPSDVAERAKRDTISLVGFIAQYRAASGDRFIPM